MAARRTEFKKLSAESFRVFEYYNGICESSMVVKADAAYRMMTQCKDEGMTCVGWSRHETVYEKESSQ